MSGDPRPRGGFTAGAARPDTATVKPFGRVAVIGVGLIGGSVAAAMRARGLGGEFVGYSVGTDARDALARGLIDVAAGSVQAAVEGADLVVLAAPIPAICGSFPAFASRLSGSALVTDTASTKRSVIDAARATMGDAFPRFVPAHPIAGSERHGPGAARASLYEGCATILCPQPETDAIARERIGALWAAFGARVVEMDAATHDAIFAEVSHWPHAAVFAMCAAIARGPRAADAQRFAGPGLRDSTRIGAASPPLWADILLDNRAAVLDCAEAFERELATLLDALRAGDREALVAYLEVASRWRQGIR